jgi:SAM-dependent methyltransferase
MPDPTPQQPRIYIDERIQVHEGERAAALLAERAATEAAAIDDRRGVARVDRARWEEAQRYERRTWLEAARYASSDRNERHRDLFANYAPIAGQRYARGIELGCGPFTNMRLILERCAVGEVCLLDPLLSEYLAHPFCQYRDARLGGVLRNLPPLRALRHAGEFARNRRDAQRAGGARGKPVRLVTSMIEEFETAEQFDLVVMVNVIEHCQDVDRVFAKILSLLAPGGTFLFADRLYRADEVRRLAEVLYDAGHPLRVDRSVVSDFLAQNFDPLMRAEYAATESFRGVEFRNDEIYFIGRRRPVGA